MVGNWRAWLVCGLLATVETGAPNPSGATTVSSDQLARGISFPTRAGNLRIVADTHYYPDRGILKDAFPERDSYWYRQSRRGTGVRFFYLPVNNDMGRMFFTISNQLDGFAKVPVDTLRNYWTQGFRVSFGESWTLIPVYYLQGNVLGDNWFDISPGYPTTVLKSSPDSLVLTMAFNNPVYHFVRIGEDFSTDLFENFYSSVATITWRFDEATIHVDYRVQLGSTFYHHNAFCFTQIELGDESYDVAYSAGPNRLNVERGWKPYKYIQLQDDGGVVVTEHGTTADRRYDEGPYVLKERLRAPPARLRLESKNVSLALDLGNFWDLAYTQRYMDMFGVQFPRNALLANYTQFGEDTPRVAAFISYTGLGMGWIPALVLGGEYRMNYSVHIDSGRPSGNPGEGWAALAHQPPTISSAATSGPADKTLANWLRLMATRSSRENRSILDRLREWWSMRSYGASTRLLAQEMERHWQANEWRDWRTKWLSRERADWPHYWGRLDGYEFGHLIWESTYVAGCVDSRSRKRLLDNARAAWANDIPTIRQLLSQSTGTVERVRCEIFMPHLLAGAFELAKWDSKSVRQKCTVDDLVQVIESATVTSPAMSSESFTPNEPLVSYARMGRAFSAYYALLLAYSLKYELPPATEASALDLISRSLPELSCDLVRAWYPLASYLAYPECAALVAEERPGLFAQCASELREPSAAMWYAVRIGLGFEGHTGYAYFPQTLYGRCDLTATLLDRGEELRLAKSFSGPAAMLSTESQSLYTRLILDSEARNASAK